MTKNTRRICTQQSDSHIAMRFDMVSYIRMRNEVRYGFVHKSDLVPPGQETKRVSCPSLFSKTIGESLATSVTVRRR